MAQGLSSITPLIERQTAAVVAVSAILSNEREGAFAGYGDKDSPKEGLQRQGVGFVTTSDGYIVSSATLVKDASKILIQLSDKRKLVAQTVALDEKSDVALLKISASRLATIKPANSLKSRIGDTLWALSYSETLGSMVATGILSSQSQIELTDLNLPYWVAGLTPNINDLGTPIFNLQGELLAMISRPYVAAVGQGYGTFLIPAHILLNHAEQLRKQGRISRNTPSKEIPEKNLLTTTSLVAQLGFSVKALTAAQLKSLKLKNGLLISQVDGDAAQEVGLMRGDILLAVGNKNIESVAQLEQTLMQHATQRFFALLVQRGAGSNYVVIKNPQH